MPTDLNPIVTRIDQDIAVILFNNPKHRNPLSREILLNLKETLASLTAREEVTTIIFTGTGDVFASGADIKELATLTADSALQFSQLGQELFAAVADSRPITIAAINGYCMGGALDLALACDIRVSAPTAVFAHPGVRLGIITGWGGTQRLPRLIGRRAALDLLLTGRRVGADEALALGLVSSVSIDPLATAHSIAKTSCK